MNSVTPSGDDCRTARVDVPPSMSAVDQIRAYLANKWKPIRLNGDTKRPVDEGWPERWVSEEDLIAWHRRGGGIGIQVGPMSDHIACIDLDTPEARRLAPHFLPDTLKAGKEAEDLASHLVVRSEGISYLKIADGASEVISLKASGPANDHAGHQFCVAPSMHVTKGAYRWMPDFDPSRVRDMGPEALVEAVRRLGVTALILKYFPKDGRHEYSKAIAGTLLRRGYDAEGLADIMEIVWTEVRAPRDGVKNAAKNVFDTAERILDGKSVTGKTRLNEIVAGLGDSLVAAAGLKQRTDVGVEDGQDGKPQQLDDLELASRWLHKAKDVRFSAHGWMRYKDGQWHKVEDGLVSQAITRYLGRMPNTSVTANRVASVLRLAENESYVRTERWDANQDIIVCKNGTLDLRTFELREHRPEDYAMGGLPFDYDPTAKAEAWNEFIGGHLGPEIWGFLQEFAGYSLTTDTSYELALWLLGAGGTGKSTFLEGLTSIMGNRVGRLSLSDIERSSFALENIVGKTLLTATEQPSMFIKQVDIINTLVSGEMVSVNRKNKPIVDVRPTAKLAWAMNSLPKIREEGNGIFRRLMIVKFPALAPQEKDPAVKERIRLLEPPGILAWAVEGLRRLRKRDGFKIPESVRVVVQDFEHSNDPPRQFLEEVCERGDESLHVGRKELYDAYAKWCKYYGFKPKAVTQIREDWLRLGLKEGKSQGKKNYKGVKIVDTDFDTWGR
jgi:P4 family phage/plasmid primase-like protien